MVTDRTLIRNEDLVPARAPGQDVIYTLYRERHNKEVPHFVGTACPTVVMDAAMEAIRSMLSGEVRQINERCRQVTQVSFCSASCRAVFLNLCETAAR